MLLSAGEEIVVGKKHWIAAMLFGLMLFVSQLMMGCLSSAPSGEKTPEPAHGTLTVKMLNIGQGDAILVQTGTQNMLIDTSDVDERDKLREELRKAGVQKIDKIVLTHPHADHIGGMEVLLNEYQVGMVYDNGMPSTSRVYLGYMKQLKEKNIKRQGLVAGDVLDLGDGVTFEVLAPSKELVAEGTVKGYKHDPNNESVVGRLVFGSFTMMFTGDAEKKEEEDILKTAADRVQSKVLKVGHHGSKTSSSAEFLRAMQPETALISCGEGNDYGHPHKETLKKFDVLKLAVYTTPRNGTITVTSDGKTYKVMTERGEKL